LILKLKQNLDRSGEIEKSGAGNKPGSV